MAYDHQKDLVIPIALASQTIPAQTPAIKAAWYNGMRKFRLRRVGMTITLAMTVTASVWTIRYRPTPGSSSGEVVVDTITIPVAAAIGQCYYVDLLDVVMQPGSELVIDLTTAATAGAAVPTVEGEPIWDIEENSTKLVKSV